MTTPPPSPNSSRVKRAVAAYQTVRACQRRLERWLERRFPKLYDMRHAATGIGRALWPLLGPLLVALVVLPVLALLAGIVALLGLVAPSIDLPSVDLPSVDLPDIPLPDITAPAWLRSIGEAIGAVLSVLAQAAKYLFLAGVAIYGVHETCQVRRRRRAAERVGRSELLRRLTVALIAVEATALAQDATTMGDVAVRDGEPE